MTKTERNLCVLTYFTILGWLIAYIISERKASALLSFHLRQSLGIHMLMILNTLIILKISFWIYLILGIGLVLLWIIGFAGALEGRFKEIPYIGKDFQKWFAFIE